MRFSVLLSLLAAVSVSVATSPSSPGKATSPSLPSSNNNSKDSKSNEDCDEPSGTKTAPVVKGKAFDRLITIWLENTDYQTALDDPNLGAIAKQGLLLTNYHGVTHPSEPNYVATVGGDYFGINNDDLLFLPSNISSVADLLEDKSVSWAEYQEDMPTTGYTGYQFLNPTTGANDYVRKHNPLVIYNSTADIPSRLEKIKNFTLFDQDLAANALPQWSFITPNMRDDGHDTGVTFAGNWTRYFLEPLLVNPNFNNDNTLILLTFDESGNYTNQNDVYAVLLGNALPKDLIGKTDDSYYTHYSAIATVEANWGLHTLGRYDVGANVFEFVGKETGDKIRTADTTNVYLNESYAGIFNDGLVGIQPVPNTNLVVNGRTVLPAIQKAWASQVKCSPYTGQLVPPSLFDPPVYPKGC